MSLSSVVSAPGKVLVTGGYLVLDPGYHGLVIGTNARFYTVIEPRQDDTQRGVITVESPQFKDSTWEYTGDISNGNVNIVSR